MKIRALALCLVFGMPVCAPVWAARWLDIMTTTNGSIFYVDLDSVYQDTQGNIGYWEKVVHKNIKNIPGETLMWDGKKVWYTMELHGENCSTGETIGPYQAVFYGMQEQPLYRYEPVSQLYAEKRMPVPDTVGATAHDVVCAYWRAMQQAKLEVPPSTPINKDNPWAAMDAAIEEANKLRPKKGD